MINKKIIFLRNMHSFMVNNINQSNIRPNKRLCVLGNMLEKIGR